MVASEEQGVEDDEDAEIVLGSDVEAAATAGTVTTIGETDDAKVVEEEEEEEEPLVPCGTGMGGGDMTTGDAGP